MPDPIPCKRCQQPVDLAHANPLLSGGYLCIACSTALVPRTILRDLVAWDDSQTGLSSDRVLAQLGSILERARSSAIRLTGPSSTPSSSINRALPTLPIRAW